MSGLVRRGYAGRVGRYGGGAGLGDWTLTGHKRFEGTYGPAYHWVLSRVV